jgi:hypothetical protein
MEASSLPSRTAILTAAARALGSREPDASVRNPDWMADRLIGPTELALIADNPIGTALNREFKDATTIPMCATRRRPPMAYDGRSATFSSASPVAGRLRHLGGLLAPGIVHRLEGLGIKRQIAGRRGAWR